MGSCQKQKEYTLIFLSFLAIILLKQCRLYCKFKAENIGRRKLWLMPSPGGVKVSIHSMYKSKQSGRDNNCLHIYQYNHL